MSPAGPTFLQHCRAYPSMIAACTIDWYEKWPEAALLVVANSFLREKVDLKNREVNTTLKESDPRKDFRLLTAPGRTVSEW